MCLRAGQHDVLGHGIAFPVLWIVWTRLTAPVDFQHFKMGDGLPMLEFCLPCGSGRVRNTSSSSPRTYPGFSQVSIQRRTGPEAEF